MKTFAIQKRRQENHGWQFVTGDDGSPFQTWRTEESAMPEAQAWHCTFKFVRIVSMNVDEIPLHVAKEFKR